jgi:hypothetical protein
MALHEGWLSKQGKANTAMQRRYCVLVAHDSSTQKGDKQLLYYEGRESRVPRGVFYLHQLIRPGLATPAKGEPPPGTTISCHSAAMGPKGYPHSIMIESVSASGGCVHHVLAADGAQTLTQWRSALESMAHLTPSAGATEPPPLQPDNPVFQLKHPGIFGSEVEVIFDMGAKELVLREQGKPLERFPLDSVISTNFRAGKVALYAKPRYESKPLLLVAKDAALARRTANQLDGLLHQYAKEIAIPAMLGRRQVCTMRALSCAGMTVTVWSPGL